SRYRVNKARGRLQMALRGGFHNGQTITPYLQPECGNKLIYRKLVEGRPFMVARPGLYEFKAVAFVKLGYQGVNRVSITRRIHQNAGFFPGDEKLLESFVDCYVSGLMRADCLA